MRIIAVRHGQTNWNKERRFQGQNDIPLNETGREQILVTADFLKNETLEAVYSSDLVRAKDTAAAIAAQHELRPIEDERLRETHMGVWEGLEFNEVYAKYREEFEAWYGNEYGVIPGGEGIKEVEKRVMDFVADIQDEHEDTIVIATHGGVIKILLAQALGPEYIWDKVVDYASVTILKIKGKEIIPEAINVVPWA